MRVALYNQMFSMNGRSLFSSVTGHHKVHYQSDPELIYAKTNLTDTLDLIESVDADIQGICEVLGNQEEQLNYALQEKGYECFFGKGHKTKHSSLDVKVAIASKFKGFKKPSEDFPVSNEKGGGGGFVHCYFPEMNLDVLNIHLASPRKFKLYSEELAYLSERLKGLDKNVIIMGDFNKTFRKLEKGRCFHRRNLVTNELKTFCTTTFLNLFFNKDFDHIFVRGLEGINCGVVEGMSDHRLIYADLK
ncbi:endonuclease/exonuclease/phosphatase family protein [Candidatus Pacearchaeota archaeon]|nr:endonuclease/exonuclease/phosphatase family protein [Candidatus Pacearchaeota archaeon]